MKQGQLQQSDIEALNDKRISRALVAPHVVLTMQYLILSSMSLFGTTIGSSIQLSSKVVVGIFFAHALPAVIRRKKTRFIGTYLLWLFVFLLHYLLFPQNRIYQRELAFQFFVTCLPMFVYASAVHDWQVLEGIMLQASYLILALGMLLGLMVFYGKASVGSYSMPLGYYLLLPAVMFIKQFFHMASFKNGLLALVSFFLILALGSRGPIMCICVFILLRILRPWRRLRYGEVISYLSVATLVMVLAIWSDEVLVHVQDLLLRLGLRSRSISLFLAPGVHLSGRERLYSEVIASIIEHPLVGTGIGGDRYILGGSYVHSIFLEILAHYGVIIGMIVIVGILVLLLQFCFTRNKQEYDMFTVWLSIGFIPLLVSSSYLTNTAFWVFAGLITRRIKHGYLRRKLNNAHLSQLCCIADSMG
jgi:hypothetical protein